MMLKAKQNSFLKWFIGIVFLVVALCSFMTTAFAAPDPSDVYICAICNERFAFFPCNVSESLRITYQDYFSVQDIQGITNESERFYVNGYGYVGPSDKEVFVADYNGNPICYSCLEQKVAEFKTANSLNATVPASLPIHVGEDGKVTTASNASIKNNGSKPIVISSINIAASSGWAVQSKVDATNAKAGSKVIAIGFNNSWATPNSGNASGSVNTSDFGQISASGTLNLTYDAVIPVAAAGGSADETAATATIVVAFPEPPTLASGSGWYKSSVNRNTITKITLMDSYTPTGTENEHWNADVNNSGDITCYRTGTEIIMAGNGAGKILANPNSNYMFSNSNFGSEFRKLTAIENLRLLDTSKVTDMSEMFSNCKVLTSLDVSNFDTSKVTDMNNMFFYCKGLPSLNVSNFDTSKVTDMSRMFDICSGLTNLNLSNFDTSNVTKMLCMFSDCRGLTNLNVSSFDTSNVTTMQTMFSECSKLTSIDISNFNTANVRIMSYMFSDCSGLTTIYAGDNWNTDNVTESKYMFNNCTKLKGDIQFDSSYEDKTYAKTKDGYLTYKGAPTLAAGNSWYKGSMVRPRITKITLMDSYTPTGSEEEHWNADVNDSGDITCYKTGTEIIIAGNGAGKIRANTDSSYMFTFMGGSYSKLTAIENLRLLDTSNVTNMYGMFKNSSGLTSLDVSNFNTSKVTNMRYMFSECSGLTSLDLSNFDTSNVTDMSFMFKGCSGLTTIYAGDNWNINAETDGADMFIGCTNLPNFSSSKVDATAATFTTNGGYLTRKVAAKSLKLNVDQSGTVNGYTEQNAA